MYLGYDYPKYRYPSYAPWCTQAGVAAEVQYIPQPREVPQTNETIYPSALPSTAGTIPVAVATSISLVSKRGFRSMDRGTAGLIPGDPGTDSAPDTRR